MIDSTIKISGPGGCINMEYFLILRFLQKLGYIIEENNQYPDSFEFDKLSLDELIKKVTNNKMQFKVKLEAEHWVWGG